MPHKSMGPTSTRLSLALVTAVIKQVAGKFDICSQKYNVFSAPSLGLVDGHGVGALHVDVHLRGVIQSLDTAQRGAVEHFYAFCPPGIGEELAFYPVWRPPAFFVQPASVIAIPRLMSV